MSLIKLANNGVNLTAGGILTPATLGSFHTIKLNRGVVQGKLSKIINNFFSQTNVLVNLVIMIADQHNGIITTINDQSETKHIKTCDGVIFHGKGAAVFFPADCPAVVWHDPQANITGLLHVSRKNLASDIIVRFADQWRGQGGNYDSTIAGLLPCICANCLNYPEQEFKEKIRRGIDIPLDEYTSLKNGRVYFNLRQLVIDEVQRQANRVIIKTTCTCCSPDIRYWSHRRGNHQRGAALVVNTKD